jgi:hypothetical protein
MADLWIQVEVGLPSSKLVTRARMQLGLDTNQAIGILVRLWLAVMEEGCQGHIGERDDEWIEDAVRWKGEPGAFAAFVRQYHIDENGVVLEWLEKYGALELLRAEAARIKRAQRAKTAQERAGRLAAEDASPVDGPVDTQQDGPATGPVDPSLISTVAVESPGKSKEQKPVKRLPDNAETVWARIRLVYPARSGGQGWIKARELYLAHVLGGADPEAILVGTTAYATHCTARSLVGTELVKMAQTFFGKGRWWAEDYSATPTIAQRPTIARQQFSTLTDLRDDR